MVQLELPEIETLRRDLERDIVGKKVKKTELKSMKSVEGHRTKKSFADAIVGAKIVSVERVALSIVIQLDNEHTLIITLGAGARLERMATKVNTESDVELAITFTQGGDLRMGDPEGSCVVVLVPDAEVDANLPDDSEIGMDLLARPVSWVDFGRFVLQHDAPLKLLLMDPKVFVGIGEIYSDEILFDAGLRYDRPANQLTTQEVRRLNRSVVGILNDAIKYRGTSLENRPFHDLAGVAGDFGDHLAVYGRAGELSPRSRLPIEKATFKKRTVYFCSTQV